MSTVQLHLNGRLLEAGSGMEIFLMGQNLTNLFFHMGRGSWVTLRSFCSRYSRWKSLVLLSDFASSKYRSQNIIVVILFILYPPGPLPITPAAPTVSFWTRTGLCTQWLRHTASGTKPGHLRSLIPARQFVNMHILSQIYSSPSSTKHKSMMTSLFQGDSVQPTASPSEAFWARWHIRRCFWPGALMYSVLCGDYVNIYWICVVEALLNVLCGLVSFPAPARKECVTFLPTIWKVDSMEFPKTGVLQPTDPVDYQASKKKILWLVQESSRCRIDTKEQQEEFGSNCEGG